MGNDFNLGIGVTPVVDNQKIQTELNQKIKDIKVKAQLDVDSSEVQKKINNIAKTQKDSLKLKYDSSSYNEYVKLFDKAIQKQDKFYLQQEKLKTSLDTVSNRANAASTSFKTYLSTLNQSKISSYSSDIESISSSFDKAAKSGKSIDLSNANSQLAEFKSRMKASGAETDSWTQKVKDNFSAFTNWYLIGGIVSGAVRSIKSMVSNVSVLNKSMTDLYKVTDLTEAAYTEFLTEASVKAKELGASISDLVDSSADFARLGYNILDASELARVATLYKNVGDIDISDATNSIISTMKAFNYGADQAENIVDVFNNVGNKFAISSAGIGEALRNSASSFVEANNTLEQSTALTVGANNVMQDPSAVGTMWKTVSMRIRGATTELESAGLETEGMVKSTADLQRLIKGLTGFDILEEDQETFKSTYDIIVGIGEEYQKLSDINQASLLEALAGKRQGNALASALNNIKDIKDSYSAAVESAGSAQEEQNKYAESLEYSLNVLEANVESLSNTLISSDMLKFFVDLGTKGVAAVDGLANSFAGLPVALSTISAIASTKNLGISNVKYALPSCKGTDAKTQKCWEENKYYLANAWVKTRKYRNVLAIA